MEYTLDTIDYQILEILQKNARTSLKVIAEQVFLSSTAVSSRIERLKECGIITGFHAHINPHALGLHLSTNFGHEKLKINHFMAQDYTYFTPPLTSLKETLVS